jgi:hypothetical protein
MEPKKLEVGSREWFFKFQEDTFKNMLEITRRKNADYAGNGGDAFNNFTRVEVLGIASTEQGFLTRMNDKFSRIISFMQNGELQVKDESVDDTLLDLANYCLLMAGYLKAKREKAKTEPYPPTSETQGEPEKFNYEKLEKKVMALEASHLVSKFPDKKFNDLKIKAMKGMFTSTFDEDYQGN